MKTILFVWVHQIDVTLGGIERVTSLLMNRLSEEGYKCLNLICTNGYTKFYVNNKILEKNELYKKDLEAYIIEQKVNLIINQDAYSSLFSKIFNSFNLKVNYVMTFHSSPLMYEVLYSKRRLVNEILHSESWKQKIFWLFRLFIYSVWYPRTIERATSCYSYNYGTCDKYVLLSNLFISDFQKYLKGSNVEKCIAIPNPLSFPKIEDSHILSSKKKEVLIVSRLCEQEKRISLCLLIWKKVQENGYNDWKLKIVGAGPDEMKYRKMVSNLHLQNVSFEGCRESYPYYKSASVFLMTSAFEGWGLTLTESLQNGVVPIAMDSYSSLHDILRDGFNGYIVPNGDINLFSERLIFLMNHQEERYKLALNGLESAQWFDLDVTVAKWINLIESL